jgi:hypothetical protein
VSFRFRKVRLQRPENIFSLPSHTGRLFWEGRRLELDCAELWVFGIGMVGKGLFKVGNQKHLGMVGRVGTITDDK